MRHWKTILLAVIIIIIFTGTFLLLTRQPEIAPRAFAPNVVSSASIARGKALAALGERRFAIPARAVKPTPAA